MVVMASVPRVLIAGIGNIFLGDDAFGVEVVRRLDGLQLTQHVRVLEVGTRSLHLAYDMLEGSYDLAILVDAITRGEAPGTLYVMELPNVPSLSSHLDAHSVRPEHVLGMLRILGGRVGRTLIVGCEPQRVDGVDGLSAPVAGAVNDAVALVQRLVQEAVDPATFAIAR